MQVPPTILRAGLRALRPLFTTDNVSLASKRRIVEAIAGASKIPPGVITEPGLWGGVPVQRVTPPNALPNRTILFLHGGGYASGSARGYRGLAGALAKAAGTEVILADYRLAPEHPFPAALEDALQIYRELARQSTTIAVAGDSAGGGLTLALAQRVRDISLPRPAALGLICPWLDLALDQGGARAAGKDPLIIPSLMSEWCSYYAGARNASEPGISPIYGNLASLPPIVIHSAGDDPLAADADALESRMAAHESSSLIHRRYTNRWHDFHLQVGFLADADSAVDLFGRQLAKLMSRDPVTERGRART
jgi:acetyl esterase/lipase